VGNGGEETGKRLTHNTSHTNTVPKKGAGVLRGESYLSLHISKSHE